MDMEKKNGYTSPGIPEEKRFFAKRVRNLVIYTEYRLRTFRRR